VTRLRGLGRRIWARQELRIAAVIVPLSLAVAVAAAVYAAAHGRLDLGLPPAPTTTQEGAP
jgi:hypothetical protein